MKYRQLGRTDLQVSSIGLGCVTFGREIDQQTACAVMDHALERLLETLLGCCGLGSRLNSKFHPNYFIM